MILQFSTKIPGFDFLNDSNGKMHILYLTHKPIFPVVDGGCMAMHQFLKCLIQNNYAVKHCCFSTQKHPYKESDYPEKLNKSISTSSCQINTSLKILPALKCLFTRESYNISRFNSKEIHDSLSQELVKENYTHIILESLFLSPYISTIRNFSKAKIVVRTHNVEHKIWEQLALNASNPFKKWYLNRLSEDLKKYEISVLNTSDLLFTISETDAREFKKLGIIVPIATIPVALEPHTSHINYSKQHIFFLGSMNWLPNIEAVEWIINEILPAVRLKIPSIEFHLAGSYMNDAFPTDRNKGIINYGFVDDRSHFMQNNGILALPIRSGSGIRIKLLEALSLGVPVVCTKAGAQGINNLDTVCLAESTTEFVEQLIELLNTEEKRKTLGKTAHHYIEENYSISTISSLLRERIEEL